MDEVEAGADEVIVESAGDDVEPPEDVEKLEGGVVEPAGSVEGPAEDVELRVRRPASPSEDRPEPTGDVHPANVDPAREVPLRGHGVHAGPVGSSSRNLLAGHAHAVAPSAPKGLVAPLGHAAHTVR